MLANAKGQIQWQMCKGRSTQGQIHREIIFGGSGCPEWI